MSNIIFIKNHSYELGKTLPVVDGSVVKSNFALKQIIVNLLDSVGYRFGINHPVPASLTNYNYVKRSVLVNMLRNLVVQIDSYPQNVFDLFVIGNCGFEVSLPINKDRSYRVCRITLSSDQRSETHFCTINEISEITSRFLHSSCFTNKKVTIV